MCSDNGERKPGNCRSSNGSNRFRNLIPKPLIPVQFGMGVPFHPLHRKTSRDGNFFSNLCIVTMLYSVTS